VSRVFPLQNWSISQNYLCLDKSHSTNREGLKYDESGKAYWRGRVSTVDLLIITRLDQHLFMLKTLLTPFAKQPNLMRRSMVLSLPLHLVFPGWDNQKSECSAIDYQVLLVLGENDISSIISSSSSFLHFESMIQIILIYWIALCLGTENYSEMPDLANLYIFILQ
jgi:hypothetical protein